MDLHHERVWYKFTLTTLGDGSVITIGADKMLMWLARCWATMSHIHLTDTSLLTWTTPQLGLKTCGVLGTKSPCSYVHMTDGEDSDARATNKCLLHALGQKVGINFQVFMTKISLTRTYILYLAMSLDSLGVSGTSKDRLYIYMHDNL